MAALRGQVRLHRSRYLTVCVLGVSILVANSCDEYNRADISDDGKFIAFSLGEKGFETTKSSEMYIFDVEKCEMDRVTFNEECDAWADLQKGSDLLFVRGEKGTGGIYAGETKIVGSIGNSPLWIGKDKIFFAAVAETAKDELRILFYLWGPGGIEKLAELPADKDRTFLLSTLPAFYEDQKLYYALATNVQVATSRTGEAKERILRVEIYSLDMTTKARRAITEFNFEAGSDEKSDWPVGFVDLAISSDDKLLICCFLPGKKISLEGFNDRLNSLVYIVDVESGKKQLFSHEFNMYYPQWVPRPASTTRPESQSTRGPVKTAGRRFMYLSGTGHKEGRSVWITDLDRNRGELAVLPDKAMKGYTGWTWLGPERARIFHVGNSGLYVIDVNADGSERRRAFLSAEKLAVLKKRADLTGMIEYLDKQRKQVSHLLAGYFKKELAREADELSGSFSTVGAKLKAELDELNKTKVAYEFK